MIDQPVRRHPAQPVKHMIRRFQRGQFPVQLQKHILRDLFRQRPIPQVPARHAEHHGLVFPHQFLETLGVVCHCSRFSVVRDGRRDSLASTCAHLINTLAGRSEDASFYFSSIWISTAVRSPTFSVVCR